jgi:branched-chain amino acid transport system substrate-binding protein
VAVYIASFDECVGLFKQANTDPVFSSVRWYGGDGVVLSPAITADPQAAAFATATQFFAPNFGLPLQPHPGLASLETAIKSKTGIDPDAYSFAAYDAMWVIAKTIVSSPTTNTDFEKLKQGFRTEADQYYGITGPLLLNANGDRSTGSFDYWGIVLEGGTHKWKLVGKSL